MRSKNRRPFAQFLPEGSPVYFAARATTDARWLIGLDPGHASKQVAVLLACFDHGHAHIAAEEVTQNRSALYCIRRLERWEYPPCKTVGTESAAWATPAGHKTSLAVQLTRENYDLIRCTGPISGRVTMLANALNRNASGVSLTIDPRCEYVLRALRGFEYKTTSNGRTRHATPGFAHGFDAASYALQAALQSKLLQRHLEQST